MAFRARTTAAALLAIVLGSQSASLAAQDIKRGVGDDAASDSASLRASKYHALLIAVEKYSDPSLPRLQAPVRDAEKLRDVLTQRYRFNPRDVTILPNPKRENLVSELNRLAAALGPNDNLLIFYAGHGIWDEASRRSYWLPVDAKRTNTAQWFSNADLETALATMKARHILVIADACYAGALLLREVPPDKAMSRLYEKRSRKAMTSGSKETVPDKSVFLDYLTKRLDANSAAYLPADELFASFRTAVMNNSPVEPQFGAIRDVGDEGGMFLFPLRQPRAGGDSVVADLGDTTSRVTIAGDSSRGTLPANPVEAVQLRVREFVDRIAKKDLRSLDEDYRAMPGEASDWKEKLLVFVRNDLTSATVKGKPDVIVEDDGNSATVDLQVTARYKDPVVAGSRQAVLHFLVRFRRIANDWSPRSYSLVEKPPF